MRSLLILPVCLAAVASAALGQPVTLTSAAGKTYDLRNFQRTIAAQNTLAEAYGTETVLSDHLVLTACRRTGRHRSRCRWMTYAGDVSYAGIARFRTRRCDVYTSLHGTRTAPSGIDEVRVSHIDRAPDWLCQ